MRILPMRASHLPEVAILAEQLGYPCSLEELSARFATIEKSEEHALFVAVDKEHVHGWIQVNKECSSLVAEARAEISALVVDEVHRSKKIGTLLIQAAEAWVKQKNLPLIRIRSNIKREGAHRFYKRNMYLLAKSWHLFVKKL